MLILLMHISLAPGITSHVKFSSVFLKKCSVWSFCGIYFLCIWNGVCFFHIFTSLSIDPAQKIIRRVKINRIPPICLPPKLLTKKTCTSPDWQDPDHFVWQPETCLTFNMLPEPLFKCNIWMELFARPLLAKKELICWTWISWFSSNLEREGKNGKQLYILELFVFRRYKYEQKVGVSANNFGASGVHYFTAWK